MPFLAPQLAPAPAGPSPFHESPFNQPKSPGYSLLTFTRSGYAIFSFSSRGNSPSQPWTEEANNPLPFLTLFLLHRRDDNASPPLSTAPAVFPRRQPQFFLFSPAIFPRRQHPFSPQTPGPSGSADFFYPLVMRSAFEQSGSFLFPILFTIPPPKVRRRRIGRGVSNRLLSPSRPLASPLLSPPP